MMLVPIRFLTAIPLVLIAALPAAARGLPSTAPTLHFTSVPNHRLGVAGAAWPSGVRIAFAVQEPSVVSGVELRTTRAGGFVVAMDGVDMCSRPVLTARDFAGNTVTLHGPALGCATRLHLPTPQLTIVQGKRVKHTVVRIYGLQPRFVTMHRGDELYIWESGTTRPAFRPHADPAYLALIRSGTTPPRACPQPDCDVGFFWDYVAVSAGHTTVDMSPGCREVTPPCEMPDFAIDVTILV